MADLDALRAALEQQLVTIAMALDALADSTDETERARVRLVQHGLNPEQIEGRRADAIYPDKAAKMRAYRARKRNAKGNAAQCSVTPSVTPSVTSNGGVTAGVTGTPEGGSPVTDACSVTPATAGSSAKGNGSSVTDNGSSVTASAGVTHPERELFRPGESLLPTDEEKAWARAGLAQCRQTLGVAANGSSAAQ